ncbi:UDP-N-acetylmuramoyl-tripeptide--D-alanyl-D-alanine ligase [Cocleimonas sp. KMM 6892]|uniref:UDP-N-acetylmuramoyl-tripeptide--D-alanyl-D- alanine ligase n=1 Tax=unclassified Cocleimonas TaxID=2639732 RepID=UPI002DBF88C6|nr:MULTISPECIES: UDP-N-acetylmuramoyl-tripeptide--D-alanyl-D-alanine ligase [unclassified Cocleimonas]MEB8430611.1 UDP-N-acetylmuramoyl-tripeptide--D-alanyl-D-alanine ligase [Cocleimonas sp. KMM 6892]MEC4716938.1 UDP-N-acetylmuramoyl-tripeptide--D-alanyl-D-alanine ligase [Cocleimonas sp. KMM 6895]MEC4743950.1 UDP-N-acetylmuramoyl-tripeptide--D-alanyl-D-alanine ligase [Cocleimonas sp. KMM 6896]
MTQTANKFLSLSEIAQKVGGVLHGDDLMIDSVSTDSRLVKSDQLFIAIIGERFDAHDFVADLTGVAGAALVSKKIDCDLPQIVVEDTLQALADLAAAWRQQYTKPLIALTGSNGKTTLKEMIAAILSQQGKVLATMGNLNNNIGMPLTLLRLREEHDFAVIEMGANHFGEIEFLTTIAKPDVAVVNNAGAAHLEGFINLEGVAQAKGEIFIGLGTHGIAVINADDTFADYWMDSNKDREVIAFGINNVATISGSLLSDGGLMIKMGENEVRANLKLLGRHNAMNALAAAAATSALGIKLETIVKGLESMLPVKGRLAPVAGINNSQILDDTYNANPDSVVAALDVLAQRKNTVFVLGDLGELGENPEKVHEKIGEKAKAVGIKHMYCLGDYSANACNSFGKNGKSFEEMDDLLSELKTDLQNDFPDSTTILIKGSRFMRMERAVEALSIEYGETA